MLVITGIFENERFIPDRPVSIPEKKKVVVIVEEHAAEASDTEKKTKLPTLTMAQIKEWSKAPEIQSLVGVLKSANLSPDITIKDIRNDRLERKCNI